MNKAGLTFGLRWGYEMLRSSRQKGWKSGVAVERASAMPVATLGGLFDRFCGAGLAYSMIAHSRMYER